MLNLRAYVLFLPLVAMLSGCLYELTLDDKGGGTMTATFSAFKPDLPETKRKMQSASVKLVSADLIGEGEKSQGVFKLSFADVTKLSTVPNFSNVKVTRSDGEKKGTKKVTASIRNERSLNIPENMLDRFGREVKIVTTFPGEVVETNGTVSGGNTVTWRWELNKFFDTRDVELSATYKEAGGSEGGGTPPSGSPTLGAAAGTPTAAATVAPTQRPKPKKKK